jgi:hypothetical protein
MIPHKGFNAFCMDFSFMRLPCYWHSLSGIVLGLPATIMAFVASTFLKVGQGLQAQENEIFTQMCAMGGDEWGWVG